MIILTVIMFSIIIPSILMQCIFMLIDILLSAKLQQGPYSQHFIFFVTYK
jgi:hypothetical protein